MSSPEKEHNATHSTHADNAEFEDWAGGQVGELGSQVGSNKLSYQGLDKDAEVQLSLNEIAKATGNGYREDDHHAGADGLYEWNSEDYQQGKLNKGGGTDAEGSRDEAVDGSSNQAVDIKLLSCQEMIREVELGVEPVGLIYLQVQQHSRQQHNIAGHIPHQLRIQHHGNIGTSKGAKHTADAQNGTSLDYNLSLLKVAVGTGQGGKNHGSQGYRQGSMHRHMEYRYQHGDGDTSTASTNEANNHAQKQHCKKNHVFCGDILRPYSENPASPRFL